MTGFMLDSGIDSLNEAILHLLEFEKNSEHKHLRFVLIHLDGAIELIIKKSLIDRGKDVIKKYGHTKGVLDCLDDVKKEKEEAEKHNNNHLKDVIFLNEIALLHKYRNNAQHIGSITKEEQLMEIIPKVLEAIRAYLEIFFDKKVDALDSYINKIGIKIDPLRLYFDEANSAYYSGENETAFMLKFSALQKTIHETRKILFDKEDIQSFKSLSKATSDLIKHKLFETLYNENDIRKIPVGLKVIQEFRNQITHGIETTEEDFIHAWSTLNSIEYYFFNAYLALKNNLNKYKT